MLLQASNPDLVSLASCYADLPCADGPPWTAEQEKDHEEARAGFECDTAERREQFAATIQGKADRTAPNPGGRPRRLRIWLPIPAADRPESTTARTVRHRS